MKAYLDVIHAENNLKKARENLNTIRARRKIVCSCEKKHSINKLDLIITHWYTAPHGCTGGDYWNEGEWQFECPETGMLNRFMFDDWKVNWEKRTTIGVAAEPTFKAIYRGLFKSSRNTYDKDEAKSSFFNNFYIDLNRTKFELPEKPNV